MSIKTGCEYVGYIDPWTDEERLSDEEVVRCRDCKYVTDEGYGCKYFSHYEQGASYRWEDVPAEVKPDGFCAWGEEREVER